MIENWPVLTRPVVAGFNPPGDRWPERKAEWLCENIKIIENLGGLAEARREALNCSDAHEKVEFMRRFHGIGPKYARNVWMDVYHPDFRDTIAIDSRITEVTRALGESFSPSQYRDHERFYLSIAEKARLTGWDLDRLLYHFKDKFLNLLIDNRN
ncbi:MAG: hypothetical protein GXY44_16605 [Phycisphaerales bacterium]|nr:hypothetical protein [Phycisphaerales bacterium]